MTLETKKRIHLIYGIVLSAVTILAGICFIAACCNIYYSGVASGASQIYTREIVAESFSKIAIPVYACLTLVIGGMVLNLALPMEKPRLKPEKNLQLILRKLQEKTDLAGCDNALHTAIEKQKHLRKVCAFGSGFSLSLAFVLFLAYVCNPNHWGTNSTPSMAAAMIVMFMWLIIPFITTVLAAYIFRKSMEKEIELMRQAAAQAPKEVEKTAPKARSSRSANIARIAILAVGAALVILGACNEGTADILTKAVNICTECVGLG